jgi:hypothetical protein
VRARLRERVSNPCGDDGGVEPADHPPGGGGCAALLISSRCMESDFVVVIGGKSESVKKGPSLIEKGASSLAGVKAKEKA